MNPNHVVNPVVDQLPDENDIERLFPKCPPKIVAGANSVASGGNGGNGNRQRGSSFKSSRGNVDKQRRQTRHKVQQHSRRELEARRRALFNQGQSNSLLQDNGHSSDSSFDGEPGASSSSSSVAMAMAAAAAAATRGHHLVAGSNGLGDLNQKRGGQNTTNHQLISSSAGGQQQQHQRRIGKYNASQSLLQQLQRSQSSYNNINQLEKQQQELQFSATAAGTRTVDNGSNYNNGIGRPMTDSILADRSLIVKAIPPQQIVLAENRVAGIVKSASSFIVQNEPVASSAVATTTTTTSATTATSTTVQPSKNEQILTSQQSLLMHTQKHHSPVEIGDNEIGNMHMASNMSPSRLSLEDVVATNNRNDNISQSDLFDLNGGGDGGFNSSSPPSLVLSPSAVSSHSTLLKNQVGSKQSNNTSNVCLKGSSHRRDQQQQQQPQTTTTTDADFVRRLGPHTQANSIALNDRQDNNNNSIVPSINETTNKVDHHSLIKSQQTNSNIINARGARSPFAADGSSIEATTTDVSYSPSSAGVGTAVVVGATFQQQTADSEQPETNAVINSKRDPANSNLNQLISNSVGPSQNIDQQQQQQLMVEKSPTDITFIQNKTGEGLDINDNDGSSIRSKDEDKYINLFVYDNATQHLQKTQIATTSTVGEKQQQHQQQQQQQQQRDSSKGANTNRYRPRGKRSTNSNGATTGKNTTTTTASEEEPSLNHPFDHSLKQQQQDNIEITETLTAEEEIGDLSQAYNNLSASSPKTDSNDLLATQSSTQQLGQFESQTNTPSIISTIHPASQQLLGSDLNENDGDDDDIIVRHDASTEELCNASDSLDETKKCTDSRKKEKQLSLEQQTLFLNTANSQSYSSSNPNNRALNHHRVSSSSSVGILQTVDEKAEIHSEEFKVNEEEQKREVENKRDHEDTDSGTVSLDKIEEYKEQISDTMPANSLNFTKKAIVPPGHPQRIRPQQQQQPPAPPNVTHQSTQQNTIGGSSLVCATNSSTELRSTTGILLTEKSSSTFGGDADTQERNIRNSRVDNQQRVKFKEENLVSVRDDDYYRQEHNQQQQQQHQQQTSDKLQQQARRNGGGGGGEYPSAQMPSISEVREAELTEIETKGNIDGSIESQVDLSLSLSKISLETRPNDTTTSSSTTNEVMQQSFKAAAAATPKRGDKISTINLLTTDTQIVSESTSPSQPLPSQSTTTSATTTVQQTQQQQSLGQESKVSSSFEVNTRVPNLRYHKLPNETSHYSIVRSTSGSSGGGGGPSLSHDNNSNNNNGHSISTDGINRSSSIQFNTLSDGESGPDYDVNPATTDSHHQITDLVAQGKNYPSLLVKKCDSIQIGSQSHIKRNFVVGGSSSKGGSSSNSSGSNGVASTSTSIDDDMMPTTRTALIFPRLDEGLSSEPESCDDGVEDDDEKAMEADVDADDDEDEDDDDDNDIVNDLDNDNLSLDRSAQHLGKSSVDCFLRQQQQQQQQHFLKLQNRLISSPQQQHVGPTAATTTTTTNNGSSLVSGMLSDQSELHHQVKASGSSSTYASGYMTTPSNQDPLDQNNDLKSMAGYSNQNGQSNYWMGISNHQQQQQQPNLSSQPSSSQQQPQQQQPQHYNQRNTSGNNPIPNKNNNSFNREEAKATNRLSSDTDNETDRLLGSQRNDQLKMTNNDVNNSNNSTDLQPVSNAMKSPPNSREVLIEGVLFEVKYLGSTHSDCEGRSEKEDRIHQAEMAVHEVKYRNGEAQSAIEVQLFISTEKIMVLDGKHRKIMMDHSLRTISYIADIGDAIVLIVRKKNSSTDVTNEMGRPISKISCHVFESSESHTITKSISQAFQVAYTELLKANGTGDASSYLPKELDYQEVLNSQEMSTDELEMFSRRENQREVIVPKKKGEILGLSIVESGWGSVLPTVVIANLKPDGPAYRCKKLTVGDQILSVNGISLVGLPMAECQEILRKTKKQSVARLSVVPCPITVEVKIKRPDTKYQLGFSVQNGVICSLLRGGIAERGGVRVGHRIMSINGTAVVGVPHEKIVTLLASSVGEIRMKTCLTSIYRVILGEEKAVHF